MAKNTGDQDTKKISGYVLDSGRRGAEGETGRVVHVGADIGAAGFERDMGEEGMSAVDTGFGLGSSYAAPPNPADLGTGALPLVKKARRRSSRPAT